MDEKAKLGQLEPLTDEQVENWRKVMARMFGPYAYFMPRDKVQEMRDKVQKDSNAKAEGE